MLLQMYEKGGGIFEAVTHAGGATPWRIDGPARDVSDQHPQ